MSQLIRIAPTFSNIRASFKYGGVDIGGQASLVKRKNGKFVMLDAVVFEPAVRAEVDEITDNGNNLEAIMNVHPFHTMFCQWMHEAYPQADLYGSSRHKKNLPELPWHANTVDSQACKDAFSEDLDLRVPAGVDFISSNSSIHFSSVVVLHKQSKTVHVDDTFSFLPTPEIAQLFKLKLNALVLHPTLPAALEKRPGAAQDFRDWMNKLIADWDIETMCTAHVGNVSNEDGSTISSRLEHALTLVEPILTAHEALCE